MNCPATLPKAFSQSFQHGEGSRPPALTARRAAPQYKLESHKKALVASCTSTANNEITIALDEWHTHIGPFLGISVDESVTTAINIIRSFVTEEAVVQVVYQHGAWKQSGMHYLAAPSETVLQATTKICSWKHTYDQVIES